MLSCFLHRRTWIRPAPENIATVPLLLIVTPKSRHRWSVLGYAAQVLRIDIQAVMNAGVGSHRNQATLYDNPFLMSTHSTFFESVYSARLERQFDARAEYAATVLLVYDYFLTFASEVQHIWKAKKSLVFFLFIGLRYSSLLYMLLSCTFDFLPSFTRKECDAAVYILLLFDVVRITCKAAILLLRSYAIWSRSRSVLLGLLIMALGRIGVSLLLLIRQRTFSNANTSLQRYTCDVASTHLIKTATQADVHLVLGFDVMVAALTTTKTIQQVMSCKKLGLPKGLSFYLLRDGILYFIAITAWNIAVIMSSNWSSQFLTYAVRRMSEVVSCILAERLLLSLRQVDQEIRSPSYPSKRKGELNFAHGHLMGNIGAPLRTTDEDAIEEDEVVGTAARVSANIEEIRAE